MFRFVLCCENTIFSPCFALACKLTSAFSYNRSFFTTPTLLIQEILWLKSHVSLHVIPKQRVHQVISQTYNRTKICLDPSGYALQFINIVLISQNEHFWCKHQKGWVMFFSKVGECVTQCAQCDTSGFPWGPGPTSAEICNYSGKCDRCFPIQQLRESVWRPSVLLPCSKRLLPTSQNPWHTGKETKWVKRTCGIKLHPFCYCMP